MANWMDVVVSPATPLADAIAKVDASGLQVALVLSPDNRLLGILTDGNIRRAILSGKNLRVPVSEVMNPHPTTRLANTSRDEMLALMRRMAIHHLPLTDGMGRVVGLATLDELIGATELPNWVVLMAGGLGTRLKPLTENCPKPMLHVGGKPILETILNSFIEQGFRQFFFSVNYQAEMVRSHFGDGSHWGAKFDYLHESKRLGTAGALSLLPGSSDHPIVVMNGDLLTRASFTDLLRFHAEHGAAATMAVREYDFQVPYGVVRVNDTAIAAIEEKPVHKFFVNAGIYVLSPEILAHIPPDTFFDMPTLFQRLIEQGLTTAAFPLREYWLDIGHMHDYEQAQVDAHTVLKS